MPGDPVDPRLPVKAIDWRHLSRLPPAGADLDEARIERGAHFGNRMDLQIPETTAYGEMIINARHVPKEEKPVIEPGFVKQVLHCWPIKVAGDPAGNLRTDLHGLN